MSVLEKDHHSQKRDESTKNRIGLLPLASKCLVHQVLEIHSQKAKIWSVLLPFRPKLFRYQSEPFLPDVWKNEMLEKIIAAFSF